MSGIWEPSWERRVRKPGTGSLAAATSAVSAGDTCPGEGAEGASLANSVGSVSCVFL